MSPVGITSGTWSPTKTSPTAVDAMPPALRETWDAYQAALTAHRDAKAAATAATAAHQAAPKVDRQAAADAIAAGKKVPAETVTTTMEAAEMARREVDGRAILAQRAEDAYLRSARYLRAEWHEELDARARAHEEAALAALDHLAAHGTALADALAARHRTSSDEALTRPHTQAQPVRVGLPSGTVPLDRLVVAVRSALEF